MKFLIEIVLQCAISYISKGWGGRVSDKYLTEHCGLLDTLLPGDVILADRGCNIRDAAEMCCAEVKMPPFTKGKKQLSNLEVDCSREIARVRIHVEGVIGLLRQKYTILQDALPITLIMSNTEDALSLTNRIVTMCSALSNCCECVVPFE